MPKSKRWTPADAAVNERLRDSLKSLGIDVSERQVKGKKTLKKSDPIVNADADNKAAQEPAKKKRRGIEVAPIFKSLSGCAASCIWDEDSLSIRLDGARLLTYNETYSILQYRKFEAMKYKAICRDVIKRALENPEKSSGKMPFFDGPTRWSVSRTGAKKTDRDAIPVMFKYFLDSMKKYGVISDDNPDVICDIVATHKVGQPELIMTLTRIPDWVEPAPPVWDDLKKSIKSKSKKSKK